MWKKIQKFSEKLVEKNSQINIKKIMKHNTYKNHIIMWNCNDMKDKWEYSIIDWFKNKKYLIKNI